jgi:thiosulfate dehydrogenase (quinone) large subunit
MFQLGETGLIFLNTFGLAMAFSIGIKGPLDYSVFSALVGAFALGLMQEKYYEVDTLIFKQK